MNLISILIFAAIAVLFVLAIRYTVRHPDACEGCGSKGACNGSCATCNEIDMSKVPDRFNLKK